MSRNKKTIYLILLAGFLLRLFLFFHFLDTPDFFYDDDSYGYVQLAENLKEGRGFSWDIEEPFTPNSFRTPVYPVFLLLHGVLFGNYFPALVSQSFLVVASAYLLFLLAERLGYRKAGEVGAALFLFMPFSVFVSLKFLTQPLFTFILMLALWFWFLFLRFNQNKYLLIVSLLLPILALVRPIAVFIYLPFLISLFYSGWFLDKKKVIFRSIILILLFFSVLSPWMLRNYLLFGKFSLSSIVPYQMYFYDAPAVYAFNHKVSNGQAGKFLETDIKKYTKVSSFQEYPTFKHSEILKLRAKEIIFESPTGFLAVRSILVFKFFVRDGIRYWFEEERLGSAKNIFDSKNLSDIKNLDFYQLSFVFGVLLERFLLLTLLGGAVYSVFLLKNSLKEGTLFLLFLIIIYFAVLTGAVASAGLRFPVEPLFILAGLIGLEGIIRKFKVI